MALFAKPTPNPDKKMSFLGHLEEFRWHLIRVAAALLVMMITIFVNLQWVMQYVVLGPLQPDFVTNQVLCRIDPSLCDTKPLQVTLQATDPSEQFTKALLVAFIGAVVVVFPYAMWELWRFIKPGLRKREIQATQGVVAVVSLLFFLGVLFSYFVIAPATLRFFATFQLTPQVENIWRIGEVISLIVQISLAGGLLFEMPVLIWVLSKLGIVTPALMRHYRRHAVVVILIVAGILTPDPSMMSQLLLAVPMMLLYEISIVVSWREEQKRLKKIALQQAEWARRDAEEVPPTDDPAA